MAELEESSSEDNPFVIGSVLVEVVLMPDGDRAIRLDYPQHDEANPPNVWEVMGWLDYAHTAIAKTVEPLED